MIYQDAVGRYRRDDWAGIILRCLILDGASSTYAPVETHQFVDDLTPASNELACTGYARLTVATSTPAWHSGTSRWRWGIDSPVFPALGTGSDLAGDVVFFEQLGPSPDDAVDLLIAHFALTAVTLDGGDFTVNADAAGLWAMGET